MQHKTTAGLGTFIITALIANSILFYYHNEIKDTIDKYFTRKPNIPQLYQDISKKLSEDNIEKGINWNFMYHLPLSDIQEILAYSSKDDNLERRLIFTTDEDPELNEYSNIVYKAIQRYNREILTSSHNLNKTYNYLRSERNEAVRIREAYLFINSSLKAQPNSEIESKSIYDMIGAETARPEEITAAYYTILNYLNIPVTITLATMQNQDSWNTPHAWLRLQTSYGIVDLDPCLYNRFIPLTDRFIETNK
jgi:hypothetical protein